MSIVPAAAPENRSDPSLFSTITNEARKWQRIFGVFAQDALAYRAVAVIWILTDTIPTIVMPMIWLAAFNGRSHIGGYDRSEITAYYLVLLLVNNLITCHQMWEIGTDIKEGRFAAYLVRPFSYRVMCYLGFLAWRIMRTILFLPFFVGFAILFRDTLNWSSYHLGWEFFAAVILGHFVSFFITYAFGLLALYFVETRSLFNFWYLPMMVFNGQVAPLALFPQGARTAAEWLPFRYTVAFPTELFLGKLSAEQIQHGFVMQFVWIGVGFVLGNLLWKNGLKRFTGVGL